MKYKLIVLDMCHNRAIQYVGFAYDLDSNAIEDFITARHDLGDCLYMFTDVDIETIDIADAPRTDVTLSAAAIESLTDVIHQYGNIVSLSPVFDRGAHFSAKRIAADFAAAAHKANSNFDIEKFMAACGFK